MLIKLSPWSICIGSLWCNIACIYLISFQLKKKIQNTGKILKSISMHLKMGVLSHTLYCTTSNSLNHWVHLSWSPSRLLALSSTWYENTCNRGTCRLEGTNNKVISDKWYVEVRNEPTVNVEISWALIGENEVCTSTLRRPARWSLALALAIASR